MPYYISQAQIDDIEAQYLAAFAVDPATARAVRYQLIHQLIQQPDAFGTVSDGNVIAWFGAASSTNLGVGGASDFIRDYTEAQLEIRTGDQIADIDVLLQQASDDIADAVWETLTDVQNQTTINGETYYKLQTAVEIGEQDALRTLETLSAFSSDPSCRGRL